MTSITQKIQYYRSCFEADNRSPQLYSFFSAKVSHPLMIGESNLLSGKMSDQLVASDWGRESSKTLALYSKEKQLYVGAFFVFGNTKILNRNHKLIAPLLLYPAELIEEDEVFKVNLLSNRPMLNTAAFQPLAIKNPSLNIPDAIMEKMPEENWGFEEAVYFKETLDSLFSNLNTEALLEFPIVAGVAQFDKLRRGRTLFKDKNAFYLIPAIGLGVLDRTKSGRGVLNELKEIAALSERKLSSPLKSILTGTTIKSDHKKIENSLVPVTLNKVQQDIIIESHAKAINVVVGPPGTGKSYTIAALAIDAMCRGESVLIASNNSQAIEVISDKLEHDFQLDFPPIKTSQKKWKTQVKQTLADILSGMGQEKVSITKMRNIGFDLDHVITETERLEKIIAARIENEKKWGAHLHKRSKSWWNLLKTYWYERKIQEIDPLWLLYAELEKRLIRRRELLQTYLTKSRQHYLSRALRERRKELRTFLKALRARTGNLKEERFNAVDFNSLFRALPIWLVTTDNVNGVLPLAEEMFDLVIFDEATQCNIASSLPILQRGRRAVIVGDPKQLRHISFLSRQRQRQLLAQHNISASMEEELDYRDQSLLDMALHQIENGQQVHFLNEHYRSMPDLIAFSNQKFYQKSLYLMTDTPTSCKKSNLQIIKTTGKRTPKGHNPEEAQIVLKTIDTILEEDKNLSIDLCRTIGVLSPFRDQSEWLRQEVSNNIPLEMIQRHNILIGTPHFFQGEERDVMLLSFALDNESHPSAFQYLEKADVFNVSITRARAKQNVFISFEESKAKSLMQEYLAFAAHGFVAAKNNHNHTHSDAFATDVCNYLNEIEDLAIMQNHTISGLNIDLVIVKDQKTYCIDLIGYPGFYEASFPLERIKMLERMGIKVFSLPFMHWISKREECTKALLKFLA